MRQVRAISRKDSEPADFDVEAITDAVGHYLAGFANGEGSFNLSFRPRGDYRQPWRSPSASTSHNGIPLCYFCFASNCDAERCGSARTVSGITR